MKSKKEEAERKNCADSSGFHSKSAEFREKKNMCVVKKRIYF